MPCGREHFGHQQTARHVAVFHGDVVDMAGVCALPARRQGDAIRPKTGGGIGAHGGGSANRQSAYGGGGGLPIACLRHIQAMRRHFFKNIHPVAHHPPIAPGCGDLGMAFDQHKDRFGVTGHVSGHISGLQPVKIKPNIAPSSQSGRDVMHPACGTGRFAQ